MLSFRKFLYLITAFLLVYSFSRYFIFSMEQEEPPTKKQKTEKEETEELTTEELERLEKEAAEEELKDPVVLKTTDMLEYPIEWEIANKLDFLRATVELEQKKGTPHEKGSKYPGIQLDLTSEEIIPFVELLKIQAELQTKKTSFLQEINKVVDNTEINSAPEEELNALIAMSDYYGFSDTIMKGLLRIYAKKLNKKIKSHSQEIMAIQEDYNKGKINPEQLDQLITFKKLDLEITLPREELLTELAKQYWLLYEKELDPAISFGFSIKQLIEYGKTFDNNISMIDENELFLELNNSKINDLDGLLEINNVYQMVELALDSNLISSITILDRLPQLKIISIKSNLLTELPNQLFINLVNLTSLNLSKNALTQLHKDIFVPLINLEFLNLNTTKLTELPETIFQNLGNLDTLSLSNNVLTVLPETIFNSLVKLTELYLDHNALSVLPENIFKALVLLHHLGLSNNNLTQLPSTIFDNTDLREIDLSNNPLTTLDITIFDSLPNLIKIDLSGTKLSQEFISVLKKKPSMKNVNIISDFD